MLLKEHSVSAQKLDVLIEKKSVCNLVHKSLSIINVFVEKYNKRLTVNIYVVHDYNGQTGAALSR